MQVEKASADTLAPNLAGSVGKSAGVYIIGGLLVSAGAAAIYDTQAEITKLATDIYNKTSDGFKTGLASAVATGSKIKLSDAMIADLTNLGAYTASKLYDALRFFEADGANKTLSTYTYRYPPFDYAQLWLNTSSFTYANGSKDLYLKGNTITDEKNNVLFNGTLDSTALALKNKIADVATFTAFLTYIGVDYRVVKVATVAANPTTLTDNWNGALNGINEVNLPLDEWLSQATDKTGNPIVVNPTTGTATYPDGTTVAPGDITIPTTLPPVDVPDGTTVSNPAIPIDTVFPETPTIPDPPVDETPSDKLDLSKLKVALGTLTTVFPFSIPWDVGRMFSILDVEPKTPVFKIDVNKTISIAGTSFPIKYKFDVDFSIFDPIAAIARWGLLFVFDIAIILALRRLTPD